MKALGVILAAGMCLPGAQAQAPKQIANVTIQGPAVIAFYQKPTSAELHNEGGENEALSDFQFYASQVEPRLKNAGIGFQVVDQSSFRIRIGGRVRTFHSGSMKVGYYLIDPGKQPHIEYGVMTNADLIDLARKYFGVAIPSEPRHP